MKHPDLFGGKTPVHLKPKGWIGIRKRQLRYRFAEAGEPRCKECDHLIRKAYKGKVYYKCPLIGESHSRATDVRLSATCNQNTKI